MAKKKSDELADMESFMKDFNTQYKDNLITTDDNSLSMNIDRIHSGSYNLDDILGGGFPYGRIVEIYGAESSGKSSLCLTVCGIAQKEGHNVAYIDMEQALNPEFSKTLGVDISKLYKVQPDYGEQAIEMLHKIVGSGLFKIVVVDSVATLTPKREIEGEVGDAVIGVQAKLMSQMLRVINPVVRKNGVLLIFVNQIRSNVGGYGQANVTTGGKGLKFYASVRLEMTRTGQIKEGEEVVGQSIKVRTAKNKVYPPFKSTTLTFLYDRGFSTEDEIIDVAVHKSIIQKKGAWYYYGDITLGQGIAKARQMILDNPELKEEIINKLSDE